MKSKNIFEKIIDREIPATIVHEDDRCIAFRDINPAAPTHILVVPRKAIDRISHMAESDEGLVGHLLFAAKRIAEKEGLTDYRLVINNGAGAGQSVFHLHVHLMGGRGFSWPPG